MKQTGHGRWWYMAGNIGLFIAAMLFMHGCAKPPVAQPTSWPAPVEVPAPGPRATPVPAPKPAQKPAPAPVPAPAPIPEAGPSRESMPVPKESKAAGALLASARQDMQAGQFSQAEIAMERALRVEPRNARLWHEMAEVKFGQKDYGQAVQFCIKSNSLAGKDQDLMRQNWLLLEKAYLELGEAEKAEMARSKAR